MAALVQAGIVFREAARDNKSALHNSSYALRQPHEPPSASDPPAAQPPQHSTRRSSLTAKLRTHPKLPHEQVLPASNGAPARPNVRPAPSTHAAAPAPTPPAAPPHPKPRRSRRQPLGMPRVDSFPFAMDDEDLDPHAAPPPMDAPLTPEDLLAVDTVRRTAQPTSAPEHRLAIDVADAYLQHPPAPLSDPPTSMLPIIARHLDIRGYTVHIKTGLGGGIGRQCFQHQPHTFIQCGMLRTTDASSHHASPSGPATLSAPSSLTHTSSPAGADWTLIDQPSPSASPSPSSPRTIPPPTPRPLPTGGRLIVDPQLREQFTIAARTKRFSTVLAAVPAVFVGTEERLAELVRLLCAEVALSFKAAGLHMPPWREAHNIISKWMPARFTYAAMSPLAPSPAAGSPLDAGGLPLHGAVSPAVVATAADSVQGSRPPGEQGWGQRQDRGGAPQGSGLWQQQPADKPAVSIRYFKLPGGASC